MKSILSYGQSVLAKKKARTFSTCANVAVNAGNALREGYKLQGYKHVNNGKLSYWIKSKD